MERKIDLTTKMLREQTWGTPCGPGVVGTADNHLSHELMIDFIDIFFDGVLIDIEVDENYDTPECFWVLGGQPQLKKLTITNEEFEKFTVSDSDRSNIIQDMSDFFQIKKKKFQDVEKINSEYHPEIISWIFCFLNGMRSDYMDNGYIDMESE